MNHDAPQRDITLLDQITTHWSNIADPARFVLRYAPAIRAYLLSIQRRAGDSEDVAQDFLTRILTRGFSENQVTRGRFRDYLRAAIRNAAIDNLRKKRLATVSPDVLADVSADEDDWVGPWRSCLLDKALQQLETLERESPGNLYYTAIRLTIDHPQETSAALAERASRHVDRPLTAAAFRQQLTRARRRLAELLFEEVRQTLRNPSPGDVVDELHEIGLLPYVEGYLADVIDEAARG